MQGLLIADVMLWALMKAEMSNMSIFFLGETYQPLYFGNFIK